jgi:hypothetical protein
MAGQFREAAQRRFVGDADGVVRSTRHAMRGQAGKGAGQAFRGHAQPLGQHLLAGRQPENAGGRFLALT